MMTSTIGFVAAAAAAAFLHPIRATSSCICSDLYGMPASVCEPLHTDSTARDHQKQVYAYGGGLFSVSDRSKGLNSTTPLTPAAYYRNIADPDVAQPHYDLSGITTLASGSKIAACFIKYKKNNVRTHLWIFNNHDISQMNASDVISYGKSSVARMRYFGMDGVNVDWEGPIAEHDDAGREKLNLLLTTIRAELDELQLKQKSARYDMTFAVPWRPFPGVDNRWFDFKHILEACDASIVMDYDTRSQVRDAYPICEAGPNAPATTLFEGMEAYVALVPSARSKLLLGVPWYGYFYQCVADQAAHTFEPRCRVRNYTFNGVDCSDGAGNQISFSEWQRWLQVGNTEGWGPNIPVPCGPNCWDPPTSYHVTYDVTTAPREWTAEGNNNSFSAWFGLESSTVLGASDPRKYHASFFYDSPDVLQVKYKAATDKKWGGVSMWNLDFLDYEAQAVAQMNHSAAHDRNDSNPFNVTLAAMQADHMQALLRDYLHSTL